MTEADEAYQNAGEKGVPHPDPLDPPRRRANQFKGHGTWEHDRPPILGIVGRESGELRLVVCRRNDRATLQPQVETHTGETVTVNTDEWTGHAKLSTTGRVHQTVCHHGPRREWARDDDGDGIREVHVNTLEGIWTGLRNFLRPFRGVNTTYLQQYVTMFACAHNLKAVTADFLRAMMTPFTPNPT